MKRRSIGKLAGGAAAFVAVASFGLALTPSAHAEDFFSALFGGFRERPAPEIRMPFPTTTCRATTRRASGPPMAAARPIACAAATDVISRRRETMPRARRNPARASARPRRPRWSMAAISTTPRRTRGNPIPTCRTRSAIATRSSRAVPATARIRPGSHRSRSTTIPPCARATSSRARDGLVVASRNANDRRGVAMNFSPLPESVRAKFRQVPVVAKE